MDEDAAAAAEGIYLSQVCTTRVREAFLPLALPCMTSSGGDGGGAAVASARWQKAASINPRRGNACQEKLYSNKIALLAPR